MINVSIYVSVSTALFLLGAGIFIGVKFAIESLHSEEKSDTTKRLNKILIILRLLWLLLLIAYLLKPLGFVS